jgi:hypothetical protein
MMASILNVYPKKRDFINSEADVQPRKSLEFKLLLSIVIMTGTDFSFQV